MPSPGGAAPRAAAAAGPRVVLRGLGCSSSSSSQAFSPSAAAAAAVRSSADWHQKRPRRRRPKPPPHHKRKDRSSSSSSAAAAAAAAGDVWCAPVMPFAADASVDCVVDSHHPTAPAARRRPEPLDRPRRERAYVSRRAAATIQEEISSLMDSPSDLEEPFLGSELLPSGGRGRNLRGYRRSPGGIEEACITSVIVKRITIMMFQTRVLLGGMDVYDRYQDWRLDVDSMTYEELLELEDRIGYVSTGLREDEIVRSLRKVKPSAFDTSPLPFSSGTERKCSICQEEYEEEDEMGRLETAFQAQFEPFYYTSLH
ncbi:putative E3 ubiquitin-protein ligase HIP1 [Ananas comosus]|uniref:RING-type E3 ubiquitin transferase n=1 Tax=Ananas comosus TaxID=4615 RepID=A0A199W175_ANACO|nr:putative E3 ubiquitin-protein ligase HIP1 [Ananas comosus]